MPAPHLDNTPVPPDFWFIIGGRGGPPSLAWLLDRTEERKAIHRKKIYDKAIHERAVEDFYVKHKSPSFGERAMRALGLKKEEKMGRKERQKLIDDFGPGSGRRVRLGCGLQEQGSCSVEVVTGENSGADMMMSGGRGPAEGADATRRERDGAGGEAGMNGGQAGASGGDTGATEGDGGATGEQSNANEGEAGRQTTD